MSDKGEATIEELMKHVKTIAVKGARVAVLYLPEGDEIDPEVVARNLTRELNYFFKPMGYEVSIDVKKRGA